MKELSRAIERHKQHHGGWMGAAPQAAPATGPPPLVYHVSRLKECRDELLREHRVLAGFEQGLFAEGYQVLRTQVLHRLREHRWNVLGVTSPRAGGGTSLTALNLAIAMAREGTQTVLSIDADLKRPRLHQLLGWPEEPGLSEHLLQDVPLEQLLLWPGFARLVVLPGGRPVPRPSEVLTSPKMAALLHEVKHRYPSRVIVVDLPPVLSGADVLALSPHLDALLFVVSEAVTTQADLTEAMALVRGAVPILGTVFNQAEKWQRHRLSQRALAGL